VKTKFPDITATEYGPIGFGAFSLVTAFLSIFASLKVGLILLQKTNRDPGGIRVSGR
jgi:hypothetical protein